MDNFLYRIKESCGQEVTLQAEAETVNLETGIRTRVVTAYVVSRALVTDYRAIRASPKLAASRNGAKEHTTDAVFDVYDIQVVIDSADWPDSLVTKLDLFVMFANERFQVFSAPETQMAVTLLCRAVVGATRRKVFELRIAHDLFVKDGAAWTLT
jgi:hypothetical protein